MADEPNSNVDNVQPTPPVAEEIQEEITVLPTEIVEEPVATLQETSNETVTAEELATIKKELDSLPPVIAKAINSYEKLQQQWTETTQKLAEATQKAESHWDSLLRQRAEAENLQKRWQRDLDNTRKFALERLIGELLSVKDSMELGIEAANKPEAELSTIRDGTTLTLKMLNDILEKFNVTEVNPQNEKFNPEWHEAMALQPAINVEEGTVVYVHQKGYKLHERLLRPARVIVAKTMEKTS